MRIELDLFLSYNHLIDKLVIRLRLQKTADVIGHTKRDGDDGHEK